MLLIAARDSTSNGDILYFKSVHKFEYYFNLEVSIKT